MMKIKNKTMRFLEELNNKEPLIIPPVPLDQKTCNLFGSFSYLIQIVLGLLSFTILISKY